MASKDENEIYDWWFDGMTACVLHCVRKISGGRFGNGGDVFFFQWIAHVNLYLCEKRKEMDIEMDSSVVYTRYVNWRGSENVYK